MNHTSNLPLRVVNLPQAVVDSDGLSGSLRTLCRDVAAVVHRDDYPHVTIGLVGFSNPREKERTAWRVQRCLVAAGVPPRIIHLEDGDAADETWTPAWANALLVFSALAAEEYGDPRVLIALAGDEQPALVQ